MLAIKNTENLVKGFGAILLVIGFICFSGTNVSAQNPVIDMDGDGKTDIATYGFDDGEWWHLKSSDGGNGAVQFGDPGPESDYPVPADYTGDGKTDAAFFRFTTGEWFILRSEDNSYYSFPFGSSTNEDSPLTGDFDGDGKADPTVYRFGTATWYILKSSTGEVDIRQFGSPDTFDQPVVADYDGDGKDDIGIFRHNTGDWWLNQSRDGVVVYNFTTQAPSLAGGPQLFPTPGDFTGDGKADVAFFERHSGNWYILRSENPSSYYSFPFGSPGDFPIIGDYDGDGKTDAAVYRQSESIFYIQQTTDGFKAVQFGTDNDIPLAFLRNVGIV